MKSARVLGMVLLCAIWAQSFVHAGEYPPYSDIVAELERIENDHQTYAKVIDLTPKTNPIDGNPTTIKGIHITKGANGTASPAKQAVILVGVFHPREWIGGTSALAVAQYLVANKTQRQLQVAGMKHTIDMLKLLNNCEIVIVPVLNPDGYTFSLSHPDDTYRTNRHDTSGVGESYFAADDAEVGAVKGEIQTKAGRPGDVGVDLGRNCRFKWHPPWDAWDDPHKNGDWHILNGPTKPSWYRGEAPASEPEIQALEALFKQFPNARANIFYHSASGEVLYPWSYTSDEVPKTNAFLVRTEKDPQKFKELAQAMAGLAGYKAHQSSGGGTCGYPSSGGADDWAYYTHHTASFIIECYTSSPGLFPSWFCPTGQKKTVVEQEVVRSTMFLLDWAAADVPQGAPIPKRAD